MTKESTKLLEKSINEFTKNVTSEPFNPPNTKITKIGSIRLYGREVRIGADIKSEKFYHIDF